MDGTTLTQAPTQTEARVMIRKMTGDAYTTVGQIIAFVTNLDNLDFEADEKTMFLLEQLWTRCDALHAQSADDAAYYIAEQDLE